MCLCQCKCQCMCECQYVCQLECQCVCQCVCLTVRLWPGCHLDVTCFVFSHLGNDSYSLIKLSFTSTYLWQCILKTILFPMLILFFLGIWPWWSSYWILIVCLFIFDWLIDLFVCLKLLCCVIAHAIWKKELNYYYPNLKQH